jgi:hypothetical protein
LSRKNLHLVLDYPYENALCLFLTKHLNPDFYERIVDTKHGYYRFLTSRIPSAALTTALDLAIIYDKIHVHPIDLPIYKGQDIVQPSSYRGEAAREVFETAKQNDHKDQEYQSMVLGFKTRHRNIITDRINWHLADSYNFDAPIFTAPRLEELYNYKFSRACFPYETSEVGNVLRGYCTIESVLGVSFKIQDLDQLNSIRKDKDITRFRQKVFEFSCRLKSDPTNIEELQSEIRIAIDKLKEIERFNKVTKIIGYVTPPISLASLFLGPLPLSIAVAKLAPIVATTSVDALNRRRRRKYSWLLFTTKLR